MFKTNNYIENFSKLEKFQKNNIKDNMNNLYMGSLAVIGSIIYFSLFYMILNVSTYMPAILDFFFPSMTFTEEEIYGPLKYIVIAILNGALFFSLFYIMNKVEEGYKKHYKKKLENDLGDLIKNESFSSFIIDNYFYILNLNLEKKETINFLKKWDNPENSVNRKLFKVKLEKKG